MSEIVGAASWSRAWLRVLSGGRGQRQLIALTAALFLVFSLAAPTVFPSPLNLQSMAMQFPEVGLLALGVMLAMVAAGIDLSVVATADLSGLVATLFLHAAGAKGTGADPVLLTIVALAIALAVGAACGAFNGILIGRLGITPIVATLATGYLYGGAAIVLTGGQAVVGLPHSFLLLGETVLDVPVPLLVFALGALLAGVLLNRMGLGLALSLLGENASAARYAGIEQPRVLLSTYMATGILAALAGILFVARTASATPDYGSSYVFLSIVICVLAGVDLVGGFGTVAGVIVATICLEIVESGFNILGLSQFLYQVAQGTILAGVMALRLVPARGARQSPWRRWARRRVAPTGDSHDAFATTPGQPGGQDGGAD